MDFSFKNLAVGVVRAAAMSQLGPVAGGLFLAGGAVVGKVLAESKLAEASAEMLMHLASDRASELFELAAEGFRGVRNGDVEKSMQRAAIEALSSLRLDAPTGFDDWFAEWNSYLSLRQAAEVFAGAHGVDPIVLEYDDVQFRALWWSRMEPVLVSWRNAQRSSITKMDLNADCALPDLLGTFLRAQLPEALQAAHEQVLRDKTLERSWIGFQQRVYHHTLNHLATIHGQLSHIETKLDTALNTSVLVLENQRGVEASLVRIEEVFQKQLDEARAANRISVQEADRANKERRVWQERYVELVKEQQRRPAKDAFSNLVVQGNLTAAATLKESEIKRQLHDLAELPRNWYELGVVNELRHALPESLDAYRQAISLYRATLTEVNNRVALAFALLGSASCLMRLFRTSDSLVPLGEAMQICPVLLPLSEDSEIVACRRQEVRLLKTLVAELCLAGLMGNAFSGQSGVGYPDYQEGMKVLKLRPNPFWPTIAEQLGQLAQVCCVCTENPLDAEGFAWAGVELYRVLALAEPETFSSQFALALNNFAHILNKFKFFAHPDRVEVATAAVQAYKRSTKPKPDGVAMSLSTLGEALEIAGREHEALSAYTEGIDMLLPQFLEDSSSFRELMNDLLGRYKPLAQKLGQVTMCTSVPRADAVLQSLGPPADDRRSDFW